MVNFYLNIDASGSSTTTPSIVSREYIDTVVIDNSNTVIINLSQAIRVDSSDYSNNIGITIDTYNKVSNDNYVDVSYNLTSASIGAISNGNKTISFVFADNTFDYIGNSSTSTELVKIVRFTVNGLSGEQKNRELIKLNLPFQEITHPVHFTAINNIPAPDDVAQYATITSVTIKSRSDVEIVYDNVQYTENANVPINPSSITFTGSNNLSTTPELISILKEGNTHKYTFQPVFLLAHNNLAIEIDGTYRDTNNSIQNHTYTFNVQVVNEITTDGEIVAPPSNANMLAEVNVPVSVFQNVFKFKTAGITHFTSVKNVFSLPTDISFQYNFSEFDDASFDGSFNNLEDWKWYDGDYPTYQSPPYEPWVEDVNFIAKDMFSNGNPNNVYMTGDIFENEGDLITSVKSGYEYVINYINGIFSGTSQKHIDNTNNSTDVFALNQSDSILVDDNNNYSTNIPQYLLEQILSDPVAFTRLNLSNVANLNSSDLISIPLSAGDRFIMEFKLNVTYKDPFKNNTATENHVNSKNTGKFLVIKLI